MGCIYFETPYIYIYIHVCVCVCVCVCVIRNVYFPTSDLVNITHHLCILTVNKKESYSTDNPGSGHQSLYFYRQHTYLFRTDYKIKISAYS